MVNTGRHAVLCVVLALTFSAGVFAAEWQVLEEAADGPFAVAGTVQVTDPALLDFRLMVGADEPENPSRYTLIHVAGDQVTVSRVTGDDTVALAAPARIPTQSPGRTVEFALHRDDWRLVLIWDRVVVARVYDSEPSGPVVAHRVAAGGAMQDAWVQFLADVDAVDNFEREEGIEDEWVHLSGEWELISLREDRQAGQMHADKSANAFSYYGEAEEEGVAALGSWFWRNCDHAVAFRARGESGAVGLAFYVQDKDNYLLLRWDNRLAQVPGGPHLRMVEVVEGRPRVLAERRGGYTPDQWYQLRARVSDEHILCYVDDQLMVKGETAMFGQGMLGLYVAGKHGTWFDEARITSWTHMVEGFEDGDAGKWVTAAGAWEVGGGQARPATEEASLLVAGSRHWSNYTVGTQVNGDGAAVGLVAGWQGPEDAYLFRWAAPDAAVPYAGRAQLVRLTAQEPRVLAERDLPPGLAPSGFASVTVEPDYLAGMIGGRLVVDAVVTEPVSGAVGLYAEGSTTARFDSMTLKPLPVRRAARVTKEFTDMQAHWEMAEWASTRHAWILPPKDGPQVWWTKGDFHGPLQMRFELAQVGEVEGTMRVTIGGDPEDPELGAHLSITAQKGSRKLALKLTAAGEELAAAQVEALGASCPVTVERRGAQLVVTVDGEPALAVPLAD